MKGFTIKGPQGTNCDELIGVSVIQNATINLTHSIIKGCTQNGIAIGFEGTGHATITRHLSLTIGSTVSSLLVLVQH